jgi:hypothetical protein
VVVKPDREIVFVKGSKSGLYYHNTANRTIIVFNTIKENREGITDRNYDMAKRAQKALALVGGIHPRMALKTWYVLI